MRTLALLAVLVAACVAGWLVLAARESDSGRGSARRAAADAAPGARDEADAQLVPTAAAASDCPALARDEAAPSSQTRAPLAPGDEVAPEDAQLPPTSRGRLVDALTLEPIPDALVSTGRLNATTDADGRFDTGVVLDELADVLVLNVAPAGRKHEVARERWTRLVSGWRVPLEIGPTYRLRLSGAPDETKAWQARLVNGDEGAKWLEVRGRASPYLRYDAPVREREGIEPRVEVRSLDGLVEGVAHGVRLRGVHELDVRCVPRAVVRGRVLDELGRPVGDVAVWAVQLSASHVESLWTRSGANGRYQLQPSAPGRMRIALSAAGDPALRRLELDAPLGLTEAPDVVFALAERVAIRGSLQSSARTTQNSVSFPRVRLRALQGDGYEEERQVVVGGLERTTLGGSFAFEGLAGKRYELTVLADGASAWSPARLEVSAPTDGVVFTRVDAPVAAFRFDAVGAASGAPLEPIEIQVRTEAGETLYPTGAAFKLLAGARFAWRVTAGGHRSREGTERDFSPDGDGRFVARVELRPGFGARVVVKPWGADLLATPEGISVRGSTPSRFSFLGGARLAGAAILADGVRVATTDESGVAEVELDAPPRKLEAALPGWRAVESYRNHPGAWSGYELVLVRE